MIAMLQYKCSLLAKKNYVYNKIHHAGKLLQPYIVFSLLFL
jgi:hypothetical protein